MQGTSEISRSFLDAVFSCRDLVPDDSIEAFLADNRSTIFPDDLFEDLFSSTTGRPSIPGEVIATVMILQSLEGLSDRDAARALRDRISWKVACGLSLDDKGIDFTALTYWRRRLAASDQPDRIFDVIRKITAETNLLAKRTKRALDSTILDDAVATQDTVTQIISQVRRVRKMVKETKDIQLDAHDYDAGGKPVCAWDDPVAKQDLVTGLVNDANKLIEATEGLELDEGQQQAVGLLALVAGQDVEPGEEEGTWRIAKGTVPDRVISTVDPETRHGHKTTSKYQNGFKAHIAVEPETGIVTAATLSPANEYDGAVVEELLIQDEETRATAATKSDETTSVTSATKSDEVACVAHEIYGDSAYGSRQAREVIADHGDEAIIKPLPTPKAVPDGFARDDFKIDYENQTVTCPAGETATYSTTGHAAFSKSCEGCDLRAKCTKAVRGRVVHVQEGDELLFSARVQFKDEDVLAKYKRWRPPVERCIAWITAKGNRRVRYRGVAKNTRALRLRVAAINLRRLMNMGLCQENDIWCIP